MRVLIVGSGGREHALLNAVLKSQLLTSVRVAPGNAGTSPHNLALDVADNQAVVAYCLESDIDLVIVGPEVPLVAGLADSLEAVGISCFGPSARAAQLEGSKSFTREFAARNSIPGPRSMSFTDPDLAIAWLDVVGDTAVVKADGLAGGKGVVVPSSLEETKAAIRDMLSGSSLGTAGHRVVLEEQMTGPEVSLFGVCDGLDVVTLALAQDHKRVGTGETGPNTGGMGAFAPVPGLDPATVKDLSDQFLGVAIRAMAAEGNPYKGVLYAGLMLTSDGPRLVEYNCRFGDPEAQVILPLLESDALELMAAAAHGNLSDVEFRLGTDTLANVVVAADGYPSNPRKAVPIPALPEAEGLTILHSGTGRDVDGNVVSTGGRVLSVVGRGKDLETALAIANDAVGQIVGDGLFARPDIGWRHAGPYYQAGLDHSEAKSVTTNDAYAKAGVSLSAGAATTKRISAAVKSTHDSRVVAGLGSFGGVFAIGDLAKMDEPLLVATTDGVGTKTVLAEQLDRWEGCGADIVNHGINDVLVQGAKPLFFLDTVASATLDPEIVGRVVDGMAEACRNSGCVLLGGETAEMPDVLTEGSVDIAGTLVGAVDAKDLLPRPGIEPGHKLLGLASSGLHTNGYSLARKVVDELDLNDPLPGGDGESIGDALLAVHRSYLGPLETALAQGTVDALAHITGGGLVDNLPRVLPEGMGARIDTSAWVQPALFKFLIARSGLTHIDAHQVLNCGIGMVAVVAPDRAADFVAAVDEEVFEIGEVTAYTGPGERVEIR